MEANIYHRMIVSVFAITMLLAVESNSAFATPFEATYVFRGGFDIYGYPPVPQVNGFDYYFTPLALDTSVLGTGVTISSVEVSSFGNNLGSVINWDWEIHLGSAPFGLPEGQFTQTHIDPVLGYNSSAPTQVKFVIGQPVDSQSYLFSGHYDFGTSTMTATPYLSILGLLPSEWVKSG